MNRVKYFIVLFFTISLFSSCSDLSEIQVGDINDFNVKGFEGNSLNIEATVLIDNPTWHRITIVSTDAKLYINKNYIGKLQTVGEIVLDPNSNKVYPVVFNVRVANILGSAIMLMNLQSGQKIHFKLEGEIKVKTFLLTRTIPINEEQHVVI